MNVILNTDEAHALLTLVSANVLDNVPLSDEGKRRIREWRRAHDPGTVGLDEFTLRLNEQVGNFIDERTTRYVRKRGKVRISAKAELAP